MSGAHLEVYVSSLSFYLINYFCNMDFEGQNNIFFILLGSQDS